MKVAAAPRLKPSGSLTRYPRYRPEILRLDAAFGAMTDGVLRNTDVCRLALETSSEITQCIGAVRLPRKHRQTKDKAQRADQGSNGILRTSESRWRLVDQFDGAAVAAARDVEYAAL
jgi:hypothetical protein